MKRQLVVAGILAGFLLSVSDSATAYSYGFANSTLRPGDSGNGCGGCHGSTPAVVEVQLQGASAMLPGATARYEVIINNITNPSALAGFTSAIDKNPGNQPFFSNVAGEPTAVVDSASQIVNNNASFPLKAPADGTAIHLIDLTMPASISWGESFTIYTVGEAGWSGTQVGWRHAPSFTVTVAPPTPSELTADQANAIGTSIPLLWVGSGQGEHFRVLARTDSAPEGPTDSEATLVYEGADTNTDATGLMPGQAYYFAVWGKAPDDDIYSADSTQTLAGTVPETPESLIIAPLSANQVQLSWTGTSDEYRVLRQENDCPADPTDGTATLVLEGAGTTTIDSVPDIDTIYCYRVWAKVGGLEVFSADAPQASWIERVFIDRFETP